MHSALKNLKKTMSEMNFEELINAGESARLYGDFANANAYFSKAIMLQPTNPVAHQKLGIAKIDNKDFK